MDINEIKQVPIVDFSIFSALSLSGTRLRDFGIMRHTAMTAMPRFRVSTDKMSGMIMASPEVVTSSTSQGVHQQQ